MRVVLIHWKPEEAGPILNEIRAAGYDSEVVCPEGGVGIGAVRKSLPAALVIDLSRLPTQGRAVAQGWRLHKASRHIPIVFAGGAEEKVAPARERFPDALFAAYGQVGAAVKRAIQNPPEEPLFYPSMSEYSGTPLAKKLGLKDSVLLLQAPQGFERKLEPLPEGVRISVRKVSAHRVLLFARSLAELRERFAAAAKCVADGGGLWIVYPKKTSGVETDMREADVRKFAMDHSWVDYKVCAVDETWTGLLFARRAPR